MTVGAALFLIMAGAVLRFAVTTVYVFGVNLQIVGDILMGAGVLGLVLWLVVWAPWARSRRSAYQRDGAYAQQREVAQYRDVPQYPERREVPPTDARTRELYRDDPYYQDQHRR